MRVDSLAFIMRKLRAAVKAGVVAPTACMTIVTSYVVTISDAMQCRNVGSDSLASI